MAGRSLSVVTRPSLTLLSVLAALSIAVTASAAGPAKKPKPEFVPGEVIVKLKGSGKSMKAQAFIGKAVSEKAMTLKGSWAGLNMHHFGLKPGESVEDTLKSLQADPDVEYAEPNYYIYRMSVDDEPQQVVSMSDVQAMSSTPTRTTVTSMTNAPIKMVEAWSQVTASAQPTIVAVIDTGIDFNHDVFTQSNAIWTNDGEGTTPNGIDDDHNGYIDDIHGWNFVANTNSPQDDDNHGTHVSGIILGATQDIFAANLQPAKIRLMPLKFLDSTGSGTTADAVKAIYYAVNNGAKVINNSWGGGGFSNTLLSAIAFAYDHKVTFVAAAGNASSDNDSAPTYPANYNVPNMISVAATTDTDGLATFSNYGRQSVHMGAPGKTIWSTYPGNMYATNSGTSMATPFISGVAALMLRENPSLTGYQIKNLIFGANDGAPALIGKTTQQSRLNVLNSVLASKSAFADPSQPVYSASLYMRQPASEATAEKVPVGCGLVSEALMGDGAGPSSPQKNVAFFALLLVLVAPVALSIALRNRDARYRRRHTRYQIDTQVRVRCGDKELVGQVSTISLGGVQLNTDAWLEHGGIVKMQIASPDGKDAVEVEGRVVWSEEQKRYGVAFANAEKNALTAIKSWTHSLIKA